MSIEQQLIDSLRRLARQEVSGAVRLNSITTAQRANAQRLWERLGHRPPKAILPLTQREGNRSRDYFMVGKDTLDEEEDWILG